ncbi:hypothetical protein L579_1194 [Pantoea sp. AS-PWVM4]|nr:hypothetical protein L579_1194 [Pantoea sp. AS-PWVM4]
MADNRSGAIYRVMMLKRAINRAATCQSFPQLPRVSRRQA